MASSAGAPSELLDGCCWEASFGVAVAEKNKVTLWMYSQLLER
jgi:hypothetical protein